MCQKRPTGIPEQWQKTWHDLMSSVLQSGGVSSRYAGFGGAKRCGGDGSDQGLLPLLS